MYGLVDGNNFYVSCERVWVPTLERRPVGVLSNNDGCVVARSPELKALGVSMGTPAFEIRDLVQRHGVVLLSSNYELYADMSSRVQAVLEELTAGVEPYSIDEMFIRCDGFSDKQLLEHARDLYHRVHQWTGIPVCVGIGPTRTLAKLANHVAKKIMAYGGVCILKAGTVEHRALLQKTELVDVWGVGRRLVERLGAQGMRTAWDLSCADAKRIRRGFSVTLERTCLELQGLPSIELNDMAEPRQRIMKSRSFGRLTDNLDEVRQAVRQHGQRSAEKLREQRGLCRAVYVFIQTNRFRQDLPQYSRAAVVELERPSDDSRDILHAADCALQTIYRPRYLYAKAGVMLLDLIDADRQQLSLLDTPQSEADRKRGERLMATLDQINRQMGRGTVTFGRPSPGSAWQLRCARQSNRWTTRWDELPTARC